MKNTVWAISLVSVSLWVSVIVVDVIVYALYVSPPPPLKGLYTVDEEIDFKLTPSFSGTLFTRGPSATIKINTKGFRGPEWQLGDKPRIVITGDSFTFGLPLDYEQGFVSKLSNKNPSFEFLNLGVPGYGPIHIAKTLERTCTEIVPKHTFYMFYLNDTRANNISAGYRTVIDGYLILKLDKDGNTLSRTELEKKIDKPNHNQWQVLDSLKFLNIRTFLSERGIHPRQIYERLSNSKEVDTQRYIATKFTDNDNYSAENVEVAANQIIGMASNAENCGSKFTMVVLPSYAEAYYETIEPATELLLEKLSIANIDVLDLRQFTRPALSLVQWYDAHYSPLGTDLVSNVLGGYIQGLYGAKP